MIERQFFVAGVVVGIVEDVLVLDVVVVVGGGGDSDDVDGDGDDELELESSSSSRLDIEVLAVDNKDCRRLEVAEEPV